jgi:hypothetical protein
MLGCGAGVFKSRLLEASGLDCRIGVPGIGAQPQVLRRASISEAPRPHMTTPAAFRMRRISVGRCERLSRARAAKATTMISASVFSVTEINPKPAN